MPVRIVEIHTPSGRRVQAKECEKGCRTPNGFPQFRCATCRPASAMHKPAPIATGGAHA